MYFYSFRKLNLVRVTDLSSDLKRSSYLVVKLSARSLSFLVLCRDIYLVLNSEVNWLPVSVNVGLLLCLGLGYKFPS